MSPRAADFCLLLGFSACVWHTLSTKANSSSFPGSPTWFPPSNLSTHSVFPRNAVQSGNVHPIMGKAVFYQSLSAYIYFKNSLRVFGKEETSEPLHWLLFEASLTPRLGCPPPDCVTALRIDVGHNENISKQLK